MGRRASRRSIPPQDDTAADSDLAHPQADRPLSEQTCPLCGRALGSVNIDRHHLIPKTFKGKEQFAIHRICHRKIHATFTERELLQSFHTWEALRADGEIQAFIAWVARKEPGYYSRTFTANSKKKK